jgi:hypothetical protein
LFFQNKGLMGMEGGKVQFMRLTFGRGLGKGLGGGAGMKEMGLWKGVVWVGTGTGTGTGVRGGAGPGPGAGGSSVERGNSFSPHLASCGSSGTFPLWWCRLFSVIAGIDAILLSVHFSHWRRRMPELLDCFSSGSSRVSCLVMSGTRWFIIFISRIAIVALVAQGSVRDVWDVVVLINR